MDAFPWNTDSGLDAGFRLIGGLGFGRLAIKAPCLIGLSFCCFLLVMIGRLVTPKVFFLLLGFGTVFLLGLSLDPKGILECCCLVFGLLGIFIFETPLFLLM